MSIEINNKTYTTFNDILEDESIVSSELKERIKFEASIIGTLIEAREAKGLSQRDLATLCGLKQPAIARLENLKTTPQIDTLIKVLIPLGYTIKIVPLNE